MKKQINKPLVSILMTAYNAQDFVRKAVGSIVNQTYQNWELIIVDDGSNDDTPSILKELAKNDRRIKVITLSRNHGPSYASNRGIRVMREYLARMDADDISFPTRIEKQVAYLQKHPETVLLGGQCRLIDRNGKYIGRKDFPLTNKAIYDSLFLINPIQHPSLMINLARVGKDKLFYPSRFELAHDLTLIFDLSRYGKLANLGDLVLNYRQHADSMSLKNPKATFRATLKVRINAVRFYGYKPSLKGVIFNFLQMIVVFLLPREAVYPIYRLMRRSKAESFRDIYKDIKGFIGSSFNLRYSNIKANLATRLL